MATVVRGSTCLTLTLSAISFRDEILTRPIVHYSTICFERATGGMASDSLDPKFLCALSVSASRASDVEPLTTSRTISVPLPTHRLAFSALRALSVDAELSPLVHRSFSLVLPDAACVLSKEPAGRDAGALLHGDASLPGNTHEPETYTVLRTEYKATTNRMLRVAVNGFMESLGVVLGVMEELDVDVLAQSDV